MRDDRERLEHILEAIENIEKYAKSDRENFISNELVQNWMVRHLQIIGEAARALSKDFQQQHSEIPWPDIIAMRHILVHEYFGIDLDIVWEVVASDMPDLKNKVESILKKLDDK